MILRRSTMGEERAAIGRYLAKLNDVRATRAERIRRWLRRHTFGVFG